MNTCKCGHYINMYDKYCPNCGRKINGKKPINVALILAIISICISLIFGILTFIRFNNLDKNLCWLCQRVNAIEINVFDEVEEESLLESINYYNNYINDPQTYIGCPMVISGKVLQTTEILGEKGMHCEIRLCQEGINIWSVDYNMTCNDTLVVKGDNITVYGIFAGTTQHINANGDLIDVPHLKDCKISWN